MHQKKIESKGKTLFILLIPMIIFSIIFFSYLYYVRSNSYCVYDDSNL